MESFYGAGGISMAWNIINTNQTSQNHPLERTERENESRTNEKLSVKTNLILCTATNCDDLYANEIGNLYLFCYSKYIIIVK